PRALPTRVGATVVAKKDGSPSVVPIKAGIDPVLQDVLELRDTLGLRINDKRKIVACLENAVRIMTATDAWQGVLAFNDFSLSIEKRKPPPFPSSQEKEWTDADDDELDLWLSQQYDIRVGKTDCARAVGIVARRNAFHPVREHLNVLEWDGTP